MKLGDVVPIVLSSTSILFAVVAFLHGWKTRALRDGSAHSLVFLWKRAGAAGAIPMAITLIICSAKPSLLAYTPGLGLPYRARRIVASLYLRGSAYLARIEAAGKYQINSLNLF